ncbi:MAG: hypothetical protein ACXAEL_15650, partial [Candidatus Hodarchaeales archaeon]
MRLLTIALFSTLFLGIHSLFLSHVTLSGADDCLVPCDQIVYGGAPKDGIPAIDSPKFISAEEYDSNYGHAADL